MGLVLIISRSEPGKGGERELTIAPVEHCLFLEVICIYIYITFSGKCSSIYHGHHHPRKPSSPTIPAHHQHGTDQRSGTPSATSLCAFLRTVDSKSPKGSNQSTITNTYTTLLIHPSIHPSIHIHITKNLKTC